MEWLKAADSEACEALATRFEQRAFETVTYIPTGQYRPKTAYRKQLKGFLNGPALFRWNAEKV